MNAWSVVLPCVSSLVGFSHFSGSPWMALPTPTCGLVEPVFCVQKKNWKQCGWNGWTWTMAGGPGSHLQIWRLNDWIWLKHALGTCCHFLFQSFKRDFLGQLKSLEPVHFGSIHVSELIWNQIYVRYMAAGFSSNFRRDTSNQVQILS